MDSFFIDHMKDLSERSENKCIFTFSNFLNGEEINELNIHRSSLPTPLPDPNSTKRSSVTLTSAVLLKQPMQEQLFVSQ